MSDDYFAEFRRLFNDSSGFDPNARIPYNTDWEDALVDTGHFINTQDYIADNFAVNERYGTLNTAYARNPFINPYYASFRYNIAEGNDALTVANDFLYASRNQFNWSRGYFTPGQFEQSAQSVDVETVATTDALLTAEEVGSSFTPGFGEYMALGYLEAAGINSTYDADQAKLISDANPTFRYGPGNDINQSVYSQAVSSDIADMKSNITIGSMFGPFGVMGAAIANAFITPGANADLNTTFSTGGTMVNGTDPSIAAQF